MYSEHDRPSAKKMAITAGGIVAGIALVGAIAFAVSGVMAARSPDTNASSQDTLPSSQPPATPTATIDSPTAAAVAQVTTAQVAAALPTTATASSQGSATTAGSDLGVVVIDAGHQGKGNSALEPNGPGSSKKKAKVTSGCTGVSTHVTEAKRNLEIALKLEKELKTRGVKVVMVRTSQKVNISNAERAKIANDAHADLFIRLHCDSSTNSSRHGLLTLRPSKSWYAGIDIVGPSKTAARDVHKATLAATGAYDRGITARSDQTGFNWSKVPCICVEMGVMSNPTEDRKLGTSAYQGKLVDGMSNGIVKFLKSK
jgi:N-acetylmuramoyl-L-alanine amidase